MARKRVGNFLKRFLGEDGAKALGVVVVVVVVLLLLLRHLGGAISFAGALES